LGSSKMDVFLDEVSREYDYVFIDSPPLNVVTDAIVLGAKAAGVTLITQQHVSTYDELNKAVGSLKATGVNILGLVVTHSKQKRGFMGGYASSYRYQY